jgi:hypothetical protein
MNDHSLTQNPLNPPYQEFLPPGDYVVEVNKAVDKVSKNGNDMVLLQICFQDHSCPEFYDHLVYSPKSIFKINEFLTAVGVNFTIGMDERLVTADLFWARACARFSVKEWEGKKVNHLDAWLPLSTPEIYKKVRICPLKPIKVVPANRKKAFNSFR